MTLNLGFKVTVHLNGKNCLNHCISYCPTADNLFT